MPLFEEAKRRGVNRLLCNHPTFLIDASLEQISELAAMGAYVEHSICMFIPEAFKHFEPDELDNDYLIRRKAADLDVPLLTNAQAVMLFVNSINNLTMDDLTVRSYDEYFTDTLPPSTTQQLFF